MSVLYPRKQAKLAGKAGDGRLAYPHGKGQRPHMAGDGRLAYSHGKGQHLHMEMLPCPLFYFFMLPLLFAPLHAPYNFWVFPLTFALL